MVAEIFERAITGITVAGGNGIRVMLFSAVVTIFKGRDTVYSIVIILQRGCSEKAS